MAALSICLSAPGGGAASPTFRQWLHAPKAQWTYTLGTLGCMRNHAKMNTNPILNLLDV
jgi:hypothetical protein